MDLRFDGFVRVTPTALEITYRISNGEDHDVGLFNRIRELRPDGTYRFTPDVAWVELDTAEGLLVRKQSLPIPPGLRMTAYVPPYCSRVPAGATFTETACLPVPVAELQPFKRVLMQNAEVGQVVADQPGTASRVTFTVGAFPLTGTTQLVPEHPAFPDVFTVLPPGDALLRQEVLTHTVTLAQPIDVLVYRVALWP